MSRGNRHKHSIFGNYILVDKKHSPANVSTATLTEIRDYNALWSKYTKDIASKWGTSGIPTEKGFAEWLAQITKEAK